MRGLHPVIRGLSAIPFGPARHVDWYIRVLPFEVGDKVWIPWKRLGDEPSDHPHAFAEGTIAAKQNRSVVVNINGRHQPATVATSAVRRNLHVLSVRIGNFNSEYTLLDPLAKSVGQFCRLFLPDDGITLLEVRTPAELKAAWRAQHAGTAIVLLVGHGAKDALSFVEGNVGAMALTTDLDEAAPDATPKVFVSLACLTGYGAFARPFSQWTKCSALIAPFDSVPGAVASQFVQSFLLCYIFNGETLHIAVKHARERVIGAANFRIWERGSLV